MISTIKLSFFRLPEFKCCSYYLRDLLASLSLSFYICKMGVMIALSL
jgi:hypothetical protein